MAARAAAPSRSGLAARLRGLASMRLSSRAGTVLVVVLVLLAVAPLGYKLLRQRLRGGKPPAAAEEKSPSGKKPAAPAPPATTPGKAWDEVEVPLPSGAAAPDERGDEASP
jgi:hypothetical protein